MKARLMRLVVTLSTIAAAAIAGGASFTSF